jgi:hypothetical protein
MKTRSNLVAALAALLIMVAVGACAQTPAAPAPAGGAFAIILPEGSWDSLQLGYSLEPAYAKLRGLAGGKRAATISEADIETYHWSRQTLTLTASASTRLLKDLASPVSPAAEFAFDHRVFIVTLGTEFVYGGVFLRPISPMGIAYAVIAADDTSGRIVLTIRPRQGFLNGDPGRITDWGPTKNEAIRERFRALGKLIE